MRAHLGLSSISLSLHLVPLRHQRLACRRPLGNRRAIQNLPALGLPVLNFLLQQLDLRVRLLHRIQLALVLQRQVLPLQIQPAHHLRRLIIHIRQRLPLLRAPSLRLVIQLLGFLFGHFLRLQRLPLLIRVTGNHVPLSIFHPRALLLEVLRAQRVILRLALFLRRPLFIRVLTLNQPIGIRVDRSLFTPGLGLHLVVARPLRLFLCLGTSFFIGLSRRLRSRLLLFGCQRQPFRLGLKRLFLHRGSGVFITAARARSPSRLGIAVAAGLEQVIEVSRHKISVVAIRVKNQPCQRLRPASRFSSEATARA